MYYSILYYEKQPVALACLNTKRHIIRFNKLKYQNFNSDFYQMCIESIKYDLKQLNKDAKRLNEQDLLTEFNKSTQYLANSFKFSKVKYIKTNDFDLEIIKLVQKFNN